MLLLRTVQRSACVALIHFRIKKWAYSNSDFNSTASINLLFAMKLESSSVAELVKILFINTFKFIWVTFSEIVLEGITFLS